MINIYTVHSIMAYINIIKNVPQETTEFTADSSANVQAAQMLCEKRKRDLEIETVLFQQLNGIKWYKYSDKNQQLQDCAVPVLPFFSLNNLVAMRYGAQDSNSPD
jgi:hypothetical protein